MHRWWRHTCKQMAVSGKLVHWSTSSPECAQWKMVICAVYGCYSGSTTGSRQGVKFFRFPKDKNTLKKWISACKRKDEVKVKSARVCSKHFKESDYKQACRIKKEESGSSPRKCRLLHPRAVPSLQLPKPKLEAGMYSRLGLGWFRAPGAIKTLACTTNGSSLDKHQRADSAYQYKQAIMKK